MSRAVVFAAGLLLTGAAVNQAYAEACGPRPHASVRRKAGRCLVKCKRGYVLVGEACEPAKVCEGPRLRLRDSKTGQLGPAGDCPRAAVCVQRAVDAPARCLGAAQLTFKSRWRVKEGWMLSVAVKDVDKDRPPSRFDMSCDGGRRWKKQLSAAEYVCCGGRPIDRRGVTGSCKKTGGTVKLRLRGYLQSLRFGSTGVELVSISRWGKNPWRSMRSMFFGQDVIRITDRARPNLTDVKSTRGMFASADVFEGDITRWDVSQVQDMGSMFDTAHGFNQDIGGWDVSKVRDMSKMFRAADHFNQDIGRWDTSSLRRAEGMFQDAAAFNQDIGGWDMSKVQVMDAMFAGARAFNQDIGRWKLSRVFSMGGLFRGARAFNQDISTWDVSSVQGMEELFLDASAFNQDISKWNTANVSSMRKMFSGARAFEQDLSGWNTSNLTVYTGSDPDTRAEVSCKDGLPQAYVEAVFQGCPIQAAHKPPCLR